MSRSRRILVIDDDEGICEFMSMALSAKGCEVTSALNGAEALVILGTIQPDLILLDMRMPIMDGWTFARTYRELPGPHAPIVCVTAAVDAPKSAAQIQADDILQKPFQLPALYQVVKQCDPVSSA